MDDKVDRGQITDLDAAKKFLRVHRLYVSEKKVRKVVTALAGGTPAYRLYKSVKRNDGTRRIAICGKGTVYKIKKLLKSGALKPYVNFINEADPADLDDCADEKDITGETDSDQAVDELLVAVVRRRHWEELAEAEEQMRSSLVTETGDPYLPVDVNFPFSFGPQHSGVSPRRMGSLCWEIGLDGKVAVQIGPDWEIPVRASSLLEHEPDVRELYEGMKARLTTAIERAHRTGHIVSTDCGNEARRIGDMLEVIAARRTFGGTCSVCPESRPMSDSSDPA